MKSLAGAGRRRWRVECAASANGSLNISGLDWGGDGPIALLNHANGFCAAMMAPLAQLLRPHYRVIAIDARGQGDSDAPLLPEGARWDQFADDLAAVARQLMDETGHSAIDYAIGNSFGGTVAAIAEARYPNTFKRIALFDPPVRLSDDSREKFGLHSIIESKADGRLAEQARKRRAVWPSRARVREAWKDKPTFSNWQSEAFDLYINEGFKDLPDGSVALKCSPEFEAAVFDSTAVAWNLFDLVAAVACPTLLVHAQRGNFALGVHEAFARQFRNGTCLAADAGHLMPLETPDFCAELILAFAGKASSALIGPAIGPTAAATSQASK